MWRHHVLQVSRSGGAREAVRLACLADDAHGASELRLLLDELHASSARARSNAKHGRPIARHDAIWSSWLVARGTPWLERLESLVGAQLVMLAETLTNGFAWV